MISTRISRAAIIAAAGALLLAGCSTAAEGDSEGGSANADWPDTLTMAMIPSEDSASLSAQNEHVIAAIEAETGLTVEIQEATSYAAVIEAIRAGQADIASFGPFSYVVAADSDAGVRVVGALADSADEAASYRSYLVVPAGSDITSIDDLAGKTVCFVDPTSTSGYLFPSAGLLEAGIDPEADVTPVFAGGHDASAISVATGACDAGFAFDTMVTETLVESGQIADGDLEVVWESEDIPNAPTVVSTQLPEDLQDELLRIFQEDINIPALVEAGICDDEATCELPEGSEYGFIEVEDALYDGIRAVCETTQSESCVA